MTKVVIYKPSKSATQSGLAGTKEWVLEYERCEGSHIDPVMGWWSAADTQRQVKIYFQTLEQAREFAVKKGWDYDVLPEIIRKPVQGKSYSANFATNKRDNWTH